MGFIYYESRVTGVSTEINMRMRKRNISPAAEKGKKVNFLKRLFLLQGNNNN